MRSFEEIIYDCIINKDGDSDIYNQLINELLELNEVKNIVKILSKSYRQTKKYIESSIKLLIIDHSFEQEYPEFKTFRNALNNYISRLLGKSQIDYRIKKNKIESMILSIDSPFSGDSSASILDTIQSHENIEINIENNENKEFLQTLIEIGIVDKKQQKLFMQIFNLDDLYELTSFSDLVARLKNKDFTQAQIQKLLIMAAKRIKTIRKCVSHLFSFDTYAAIIEYLIENKKLKNISELVIDFNKIRNYLSAVLLDDSIKSKAALISMSMLKESSYEKNIHRILSLFHKSNKNIFEIRDDYLKKLSHNKIAKVFETHTASNIVSNFLIIDVLGKYKSSDKNKDGGIKLSDIMHELFTKVNYSNENKNKFRKYNLLPRLKELEEYGFVTTINNDKYSLNARFLTNNQKKSLEYVVPFFCGLYPFVSIGHFLANRLNSKDLFEFESFNIASVLDDCITYDILTAINTHQSVSLNLKTGNLKNYNPKEIVLDRENKLLKVIDANNKEYYLNDIIDIIVNKNKLKNPVFSEIYSYYYKIFEELIRKYKENPSYNIMETINKYGSDDTSCNTKQIKEILPRLARLEHTTIPLTSLELRWLKTIMQDVRFDLFVSEDEKHSLENLVEDVTPFDLSAFKIYDNKTKTYKSITAFGLPKGVDRNSLKKKLKEFNSVLYSIQNNSFDFNYKKA